MKYFKITYFGTYDDTTQDQLLDKFEVVNNAMTEAFGDEWESMIDSDYIEEMQKLYIESNYCSWAERRKDDISIQKDSAISKR